MYIRVHISIKCYFFKTFFISEKEGSFSHFGLQQNDGRSWNNEPYTQKGMVAITSLHFGKGEETVRIPCRNKGGTVTSLVVTCTCHQPEGPEWDVRFQWMSFSEKQNSKIVFVAAPSPSAHFLISILMAFFHLLKHTNSAVCGLWCKMDWAMWI